MADIIQVLSSKNSQFENGKDLIDAINEFDALIGLKSLKEDVYNQIRHYICQRLYNNGSHFNSPPHTILMGPSGIGKTTIAKKMVKIWKAIDNLNVLSPDEMKKKKKEKQVNNDDNSIVEYGNHVMSLVNRIIKEHDRLKNTVAKKHKKNIEELEKTCLELKDYISISPSYHENQVNSTNSDKIHDNGNHKSKRRYNGPSQKVRVFTLYQPCDDNDKKDGKIFKESVSYIDGENEENNDIRQEKDKKEDDELFISNSDTIFPITFNIPPRLFFKNIFAPNSEKGGIGSNIFSNKRNTKDEKDNDIAILSRSDIVEKYVGHTAKKVKSLMEKYSYIFIDEAYSLVEGKDNDFGTEAVTEIVNGLNNWKGVMILAGYKENMEAFLSSNQGLSSRFLWKFEIPKYSGEDLYNIFLYQCNEKGIECDKNKVTKEWFINNYSSFPHFGRDIESFVKECMVCISQKQWEDIILKEKGRKKKRKRPNYIIDDEILQIAFNSFISKIGINNNRLEERMAIYL